MGQDWVFRQPGHGQSQMWCSVIPTPPCAHPAASCAQGLCGQKQLWPALRSKGAWWELMGTGRMRGLVLGFTLLQLSLLWGHFSETSPPGKRWSLLPQWPQSQLPFGKYSSLAPLFWGLSLGSKIMPVFPYCSCPWLIIPVDHSQSTWGPGHWCCCISLQCCGCCTKAAPLDRSLWQILCCLIAQLWANSSVEAVKLHWQEIRAGLVSLGENHMPWLLTGVVHCWAGLASSAHTSWGALPFQALSVTKGYFLPQIPHTCTSALFLWYQGESFVFPTWWSHTLEWGMWCLRCCTPSLLSDGGRKAEKEMSLRLCQHKHSWVWFKKKKKTNLCYYVKGMDN